MKKFLSMLGRFFWSWRFLKITLWLATLIIFFYVEEDWRGARDWSATKAEWEAKGESFDLNSFVPPPIPDDENLGALPLFKLGPDPKVPTDIRPFNLDKAMHSDRPGNSSLGSLGNWHQGRLTDIDKLRPSIATIYAQVFPGVAAPEGTLAQFEALYPFIADLRAETAHRTSCRFSEDYTFEPPAARPVSLLTAQMPLSKILTLHAILELQEHQPDLALADIKTTFTLASGAAHDSSLIGTFIFVGMAAVSEGAIYDGLVHHEWNDAQLAEMDDLLKSTDILAYAQSGLRCDAAGMVHTLDWIKTRSRAELATMIGMSGADAPPGFWYYTLWPDGWLDQNKCGLVSMNLDGLRCLDPKAHRVFPEIADAIKSQADGAAKSFGGNAPWNVFAEEAAPVLAHSALVMAEGQVWLDETRIACAIERYRLAKNALPAALDELAPAYLAEVPHDVINGEPYHYQAKPDGTYLLYSVGWNQKDDGGVYDGTKPDPTDGDWVWPMPQAAAAK